MAQDGLVSKTLNLDLNPTVHLPTNATTNSPDSSSSGQSVWLPLGVTFAVVLVILVMVVLAKTKKRAAAMQATQNAQPHITSVSGTMGSNVNVYRNYGIHSSRQTLTSSTSGDQLASSTATLTHTLPPTYDEVMRTEEEAYHNMETQQDFADVQQVLARIDAQSSVASSSPLDSSDVSPAPSYRSSTPYS